MFPRISNCPKSLATATAIAPLPLISASHLNMARLASQQNRTVHGASYVDGTAFAIYLNPYSSSSRLTLSSRNSANFDTANPSYIRKYLRTYGLTPPRRESYEVQKTRCMLARVAGESSLSYNDFLLQVWVNWLSRRPISKSFST